jgi:hypothetical protein
MPAPMKAQAAFTPAFVGGRRDYELPIALEYPTDVTKVIAGGGYGTRTSSYLWQLWERSSRVCYLDKYHTICFGSSV